MLSMTGIDKVMKLKSTFKSCMCDGLYHTQTFDVPGPIITHWKVL